MAKDDRKVRQKVQSTCSRVHVAVGKLLDKTQEMGPSSMRTRASWAAASGAYSGVQSCTNRWIASGMGTCPRGGTRTSNASFNPKHSSFYRRSAATSQIQNGGPDRRCQAVPVRDQFPSCRLRADILQRLASMLDASIMQAQTSRFVNFKTAPDQISEQDLRDHLRYLKSRRLASLAQGREKSYN